MVRLQATTLKMMPMVASLLTEDGSFGSNELIDAWTRSLLDELLR